MKNIIYIITLIILFSCQGQEENIEPQLELSNDEYFIDVYSDNYLITVKSINMDNYETKSLSIKLFKAYKIDNTENKIEIETTKELNISYFVLFRKNREFNNYHLVDTIQAKNAAFKYTYIDDF